MKQHEATGHLLCFEFPGHAFNTGTSIYTTAACEAWHCLGEQGDLVAEPRKWVCWEQDSLRKSMRNK